ncbi:nuclease [Streptomyces sp. NPDC058579]|uniref:nuclease n=1 Tax=Streptomyces sp. NPDC058579 TaxID=3346548 RepID=UPI00365DF95D
MPYLSIKGEFRLVETRPDGTTVGTRPDGDTVRFYPDDPAVWSTVPGPHPIVIRGPGGANLRLEGIDALETHFKPPFVSGPELHQPKIPAEAAAAELLRLLGFDPVQRTPNGTVKAPTNPTAVRGYVLTRGADPPGRCIAFTGPGDGPEADANGHVFLTLEMMRETVNHKLLAKGFVYPIFYRTLFPDLRADLTTTAIKARTDDEGLWPLDKTHSNTVVVDPPEVDKDVIYPKFFRRLGEYVLENDGSPALDGFLDYLRRKADKFTILSTGHFSTGLDLIVEVDDGKVRWTHPVEDIVYEE